MISRRCPGGRSGLTVLEVLFALSIFLISLIGIGRLISLGADGALTVQDQSRAAQLCQSKLAEVVAGAVPLSGQSDVPFDEDPSWFWSLDAAQGDIAGLWKLTVRVSRQRPDGTRIESTIDRMLLDPSLRGSALDAQTIAAAASSSTQSSSPSGSSSTSGASGNSGTSSPSGAGSSSGGNMSPTGGSSSGSGTPKSGATSSPSSSGGKGTTKGGS
jgi:general secretion pathway protein I